MFSKTLFRKLFFGTILLIILVLGACAWLIIRQVDQFHAKELSEHLQAQALLIRESVQDRFDRSHAKELDLFVKNLAKDTGLELRITLIDREGVALADSQARPEEMESHTNRREVQRALTNGWGEDTRYSATLSREMKYVAIRIGPAESPMGVARVAMPISSISRQRVVIEQIIWTIMLLGLVASILFALGLARIWSYPLRRISATARSLSRGDLSVRVRVAGHDEMATLARSLNDMRDHLADHLATIDRQRRMLGALLSQLHEGVVVVTSDRRVLLTNPAANRMLGVKMETLAGVSTFAMLNGLTVEQCVPQYELQQLLFPSADIDHDQPYTPRSPRQLTNEREFSIHVDLPASGLSLLAHVSDLVLPIPQDIQEEPGATGGETICRLLVLTDITKLTRAMQVRTDFASNASHELRTPLSAIRAAIETLLSMDAAKDQAPTRPFLEIINRQTGRMENMVSDLLDLSRIESSPGQFMPRPLDLPLFLADLKQRFADRLQSKRLLWSVELPSELREIMVNQDLLQLVLDNLVDNAIKFTEPGGQVTITGNRTGGADEVHHAVTLTVADTGCGIAEQEQQRVFERFYQVEKARSGTHRGTGLGLSIVRHAVTAMQGHVALESKPGQWTRVTVRIPQEGHS